MVFEAARATDSLSWSKVAPQASTNALVLAYDRAGLGLSAVGEEPRSPKRLASELGALLVRMTLKPPFILVGHSAGAHIVVLLARSNPELVAGMVLVDPVFPGWRLVTPSEASRIRRRYRMAPTLAVLGVLSLIVTFKLSRELEALIRQYPDSVQPEVRRRLGRVKHWRGAWREIVGSEVREPFSTHPLPSVPIAVVAAGNPRHSEHRRNLWIERQRELIAEGRLSACFLSECGHNVPLEDPSVVIKAILWVASRLSDETNYGIKA